MRLSIVTTLYHSADYLPEFYRRMTCAAKALVGDSYEIIFVNDGSPDDSLSIATALVEQDSHVVVLDLSKNFGHHNAMIAGLDHAIGAKVFLIDSDLEEEPEWLLEFSAKMSETNCDVVYGVQAKRKGGMFERVSGALFWAIFRKISRLGLPANVTTCRLMTQAFVQASQLYEERELVAHALWYDAGFTQVPYLVGKHSSSPTTYTLAKKITLFANAISSYSNGPLIWIFYFGCMTFAGALIYISSLVVKKIFFTVPIDGWTSVVASIWFFGGLISFFLGIIGVYVAKVFSEVKRRPRSIVKRVYRQ